jgi:hypothetical protein
MSGEGKHWYFLKSFVLSRMGELGRAWRRRNKASQVLDEGPLQALLSLSEYVSERDVNRIRRHTPADLTVVFEVEPNEWSERIGDRLKKRRPFLSDEARGVWREQLLRNQKTMQGFLVGNKRTYVVRSVQEGRVLCGRLSVADTV